VIPHSRPTLDYTDEEALLTVIRSGHISQGKEVAALEGEFADFIGVKHAIAVSSGTAALHLSLVALGVGPGDEVILPDFVCTALLNAVRYVGATPILTDVNGEDYNIDVNEVAKKRSRKTGAVIVPHMFGLPADMEALAALDLPLIEDCAQAVGSTYRGKKTGCLGKLAIFSFSATKMLTTGEGGMVATDDDLIAAVVRDFREYDEKTTDGIRYNYKLTDMQGAMGRSQLKRLTAFINRRREIAYVYNERLASFGIPIPRVPQERTMCISAIVFHRRT